MEHARRGRDANERDHLKGGIFHRGFSRRASAYAKRRSTRAGAGCRPTRGPYVEAAALRRTDGWGARITVLGVPRRVFRFYADEDLC